MTDIETTTFAVVGEPGKEESTSEETQDETTEEVVDETTEEVTEETAEEDNEDAAEESADPADAAEEEKPKKRRSSQKRINQITREKHNAEREAATLRQQLEALQARQAPAVAPKQEDFQTIEEFDAARIKFHAAETVRDELKALSGTVQQQQQQAVQDAVDADWTVQVEDARAKYDDFDEVVLDPNNTYFTPAMHRALATDENGADIAYHIASHPKLVREISALDDVGAVLRIGRLSAQLAASSKPKLTAAPTPPKQAKGGGVTPQKNPSKMSQKEFEKWWNQRGK